MDEVVTGDQVLGMLYGGAENEARVRHGLELDRRVSLRELHGLAPLQLVGQRLETLVTKIDAARVQKKSGRMW